VPTVQPALYSHTVNQGQLPIKVDLPMNSSITGPPWRRVVFLACLLFVHYSPTSALAQTLSPEFINFVNLQVPIKYIKVKLPAQLIQFRAAPLRRSFCYEGSLQDDTFWIRCSTNSPVGSFPGRVVGESRKQYWLVEEGGTYMAKSPRHSATKEPVASAARGALSTLRRAFGLGVDIIPGSLTLLSNNAFTARTDPAGQLQGHFTVLNDGRPAECVYSSSQRPTARVQVDYHYSHRTAGSAIPSSFTMSINWHKVADYMQFGILQYIPGRADIPAIGYTGETFVRRIPSEPNAATVIFSNTAVYEVLTNGRLAVIKAPDFLASHGLVAWHLYAVCSLLLTPLLITYLMARGKRLNKTKTCGPQ
jgi:hypothetical protein